jgi:4-hydroxy-tetrahydrodipicolinate reductase
MMKTPTQIGIIGAGGRMGVEIARAVFNHPAATLASGFDIESSPAHGRDIGEVAGIGNLGIHITENLEQVVLAADVIIDLSLPDATETVLAAAVAGRKALVCGTTGVPDNTKKKFTEAGTYIPVLYARNLSLGVTVLTSLVEQATNLLGSSFDIEIIEMHHRNKVDAPSGTALMLAESAAKGRGLNLDDVLRHGREGNTGARRDTEIGMHALRGGGVFGDHTIVLASPNERVELTHKAASRALFAEGAIKAAIFLVNQQPGRYEMKDVLLG